MIRAFSLFVILYAITACEVTPTVEVNVLENTLVYPGFQTFPTPRTFDGPGYVFRIDRKGQKYPVAELNVPIRSAGSETFPQTLGTNLHCNFDSLFHFINTDMRGNADAKAGANRMARLTVHLETGTRLRTYDEDIDKAVQLLTVQPLENNEYYVVREVIAVPSISIDLNTDLQVDVNLKAELDKAVSASSTFVWKDNTTGLLQSKFLQPHYVFFTVDRLLPPGAPFSDSAKWLVDTPGRPEKAIWGAEHASGVSSNAGRQTHGGQHRFASDSDKAYEYLETLQENVLWRNRKVVRSTGSPNEMEILKKLYERLDESHNDTLGEGYFTRNVLPKLRKQLDEPLPTRFEEFQAYFLLTEASAQVVAAAEDLRWNVTPNPKFGTLPLRSLNAQAVRVPKTDQWLVTVNSQVFRLIHELNKIALDTFEYTPDGADFQVDFSIEAFRRRLKTDPEIRVRFLKALVEYCSNQVQRIGNVQKPYHTGRVEVMNNAMKVFFIAHEYAHVVNGDKPIMTSIVKLDKKGGGELNIDVYERAWRQELKADAVGYELQSRALELRGYDSTHDYWLYVKTAPSLLFAYLHILDDAKHMWDEGVVPPNVSKEEMMQVEKIARDAARGLDDVPAGPLNLKLSGHPPFWIRRRLMQTHTEALLEKANAEQLKAHSMAIRMAINMYFLFNENAPRLPELFASIRRDLEREASDKRTLDR